MGQVGKYKKVGGVDEDQVQDGFGSPFFRKRIPSYYGGKRRDSVLHLGLELIFNDLDLMIYFFIILLKIFIILYVIRSEPLKINPMVQMKDRTPSVPARTGGIY